MVTTRTTSQACWPTALTLTPTPTPTSTLTLTLTRPISGLVAQHVLVETFEPGESVASFLDAKGELREGEWVLVKGRWEMVGNAADDREGADDRRLRGSIALTGIQALLKI